VRLRKLRNDGQPTIASLYPEGVAIETPGLFQGKAGGRAFAGVRGEPGESPKDVGTGQLITLLRADQEIELALAGGSGFGDPRERDPHAVAEDLSDGYVSAEAAERDYSVVIAEDDPLVNA
jgi:5-oxoprolinase (ATP-hydrolysing)